MIQTQTLAPRGTAPAAPPATASTAHAPERAWRRADAVAVAALVIVVLAMWLPRLRGPLDLRYDAAVYYTTGTALAEGKGYRLPSEPGDVRAVQYPPLLPAVAAAAQWVSGSTDYRVAGRWLRGFNFLVYGGFVLAVYALARRFFEPTLAAGVALLSGLHHQIVFLSDMLFAEIPFALCALGLILLNPRGGRAPGFTGQAACAGAAFLLRSAGLALLAAWVCDALARRQWRLAAARALAAAIPVLAWQFYVGAVTSGPEYVNPAYEYQRASYQFYNVPYAENLKLTDPFAPERGRTTTGDMAWRVVGNAPELVGGFGQMALSDRGVLNLVVRKALGTAGLKASKPLISGALTVVMWALGSCVLFGTFLLLRKREWLIGLYILAAAALVATTPWPAQFSRYLAPTIPLLAIALVQGLRWLAALGRPASATAAATMPAGRATTAARAAPMVVLAGLLAVDLVVLARMYKPVAAGAVAAALDRPSDAGEAGRLFYYFPDWQMYDHACAWLGANAPADAVVATATPQWAYLKCGLKCVMPPMVADPAEAQRLLDGVPAAYAIDDQMNIGTVVSRYLRPALARDPHGWRTVYVAPDGKTKVLQRVASDIVATAAAAER